MERDFISSQNIFGTSLFLVSTLIYILGQVGSETKNILSSNRANANPQLKPNLPDWKRDLKWDFKSINKMQTDKTVLPKILIIY